MERIKKSSNLRRTWINVERNCIGEYLKGAAIILTKFCHAFSNCFTSGGSRIARVNSLHVPISLGTDSTGDAGQRAKLVVSALDACASAVCS